MAQDFARYIEIVGKDKVKESLKKALQDATIQENWSLVKEITELLENHINKNEDKII